MREIKDVLNIHDIPNITDYLDCEFSLQCYEVGDKLQCYEYETLTGTKIVIDMHSDETLIHPHEILFEIITQDNIEYLSFTIWTADMEVIDSWSYRPLVNNDKKQLIIG